VQVDLTGKIILITGGTGGLGTALVERALEERATVLFTYHRDEERARQLQAKGGHPFRVDLRQLSEIDTLRERVKKEFPRLDALVNNAGIVRDHTLQNLTEEDWDEVIQVNLRSAYYLTKRLLSLLFKMKGAKILNITSRVGEQGGFGGSNYAASKAGLVGFTKSLAQELGKKKIAVNAVSPGFMISKMSVNLPERVLEKQKQDSAFGTYGDSKEVADFIVYLLSDRVRNVTGQVFHYDTRKTKFG
jgi:3-oxoacyl-[acyl-carrier protein] reductase